MTAALFSIGVLTSLGCGWNVLVSEADWKTEFAWVLGGITGAAMMAGAIYLRHIGA